MSGVEEQILVVPTAKFHEAGYFEGFTTDIDRYSDLLVPENFSFRPRSQMEDDPSFKQLIPYVIFEWQNMVFQYARGKGQGESRLHSKYSIGVGGHVSSEDNSVDSDPLKTGMFREIGEEVELLDNWSVEKVGLINDDSTVVGSVHLGIVYKCRVAMPYVQPKESEMLDAKFVRTDVLLKRADEFESWSAIALKSLYGG